MQAPVPELVGDADRVENRHLLQLPHAGEMEELLTRGDRRAPPDDAAQHEPGRDERTTRDQLLAADRERGSAPTAHERSPGNHGKEGQRERERAARREGEAEREP